MIAAVKNPRLRAVVIGGPGAANFREKMTRNLARYGVEVVEYIERTPTSLPRNIDAVVAVVDFLSQDGLPRTRALAAERGIAFGVAHVDWSRTQENLRKAGIIVDPIVDVVIERHEEEAPMTTTKPEIVRLTPPAAAKIERPLTPDELRALLRSLTGDDMRAVVLAEAPRIARRSQVEAALVAVEALDDDGLIDLAAELSKRKREALKGACEAAAQ